MRALAALAVLGGHVRALSLSSYNQLDSPNILQKMFYFLTGFGHQAVIIFFVISGFLIGRSSYIVTYGMIWLAGAIAGIFEKQMAKLRGILRAIPLFCLLSILYMCRTGFINGFLGDIILGISAAAFLSIFARSNISLIDRPLKFVSNFSFSLYIIHFPIISAFWVLFLSGQQWQGIFGYSVFGLLICLSLTASMLWYYLFESRTDKARSFLRRELLAK